MASGPLTLQPFFRRQVKGERNFQDYLRRRWVEASRALAAYDGTHNALGHPVWFFPDVAFPDAQWQPPHLRKRLANDLVAFNVALDLRYPVPCVVAASELLHPLGPISTVPEVAITEDGDSTRDECYVRPSRKRSRG